MADIDWCWATQKNQERLLWAARYQRSKGWTEKAKSLSASQLRNFLTEYPLFKAEDIHLVRKAKKRRFCYHLVSSYGAGRLEQKRMTHCRGSYHCKTLNIFLNEFWTLTKQLCPQILSKFSKISAIKFNELFSLSPQLRYICIYVPVHTNIIIFYMPLVMTRYFDAAH